MSWQIMIGGGALALAAIGLWLYGRAQRARGRQEGARRHAEQVAKSAREQAGLVRPSDDDLVKRLRDNGF